MVDASEDKEFKVSKLKKEDLPSELKGKTNAQIEKYIAAKKTERAKIKKEIQELNKKRELYIAKNQKEEQGELEGALLKAIKNQAATKNYSWDN